jgi:hypothetical protein
MRGKWVQGHGLGGFARATFLIINVFLKERREEDNIGAVVLNRVP